MIPDIAAILEEAAEKIEKYGWRRLSYGNYELGFCMAGAIGAVVSSYGWLDERVTGETYVALARYLDPELMEGLFYQSDLKSEGTGVGIIIFYNDEIAPDKYDVINRLKLAAKDLRNNGIYR